MRELNPEHLSRTINRAFATVHGTTWPIVMLAFALAAGVMMYSLGVLPIRVARRVWEKRA